MYLRQKNLKLIKRWVILFKIIKTVNKSTGRFRRDIVLWWDEKKKKKCGKGFSYIFREYKKICAELQVKVLIKKQEFKEKLRNLERKLLTKNDEKVYDGIFKSLSYIKAIEGEISRWIQVY